MTKVTTLQELANIKPPIKKAKPIEFIKYVDQEDCLLDGDALKKPNHFEHIVLISSGKGFDVIAAWDNTETYNYGKYPAVFLGHWNDGFVEQ